MLYIKALSLMYFLYCTISLQLQVNLGTKNQIILIWDVRLHFEKIKVPRRCLLTSLPNINVLLYISCVYYTTKTWNTGLLKIHFASKRRILNLRKIRSTAGLNRHLFTLKSNFVLLLIISYFAKWWMAETTRPGKCFVNFLHAIYFFFFFFNTTLLNIHAYS